MAGLSPAIVAQLAEHLDAAAQQGRAVVKITDAHPGLGFSDAYDIQAALRQRKEARGERVIALKMGLTSRAKMKQVGVEAPIHGFLTDTGLVPEGDPIPMAGLIHPKVEPELAFVTKADLRGPACDVAAVLAATDFVIPALEIIDSRYEAFRFDLPSVIADNTSAARFVLGSRARAVEELDLRCLGVVLEKNGEVVHLGAGAAVLGHPAESVAMLANLLAERDGFIPAGTTVLTGGVTAAVPVEAGDAVTARFQWLGSLTTRFV